jgi:hypothetical protein
MAEPAVEYLLGFVYSVVYRDQGGSRTLVIEGELLSFDDTRIEIKAAKGSVTIDLIQITKVYRK